MGYGGGPGRLWGASGAWHGAGGLQGTAGGRLGGVLRDLGGPQVVTRTWGSQGPRSDWRGPQVATHIWGSQGCGRWPGVSEDGGRLSRVQQASGGPGGLLDIIVWRGGPLARWVPVSQRQRAVVGRAGLSPVPPPGTALTPLGSHSSWGGGGGEGRGHPAPYKSMVSLHWLRRSAPGSPGASGTPPAAGTPPTACPPWDRGTGRGWGLPPAQLWEGRSVGAAWGVPCGGGLGSGTAAGPLRDSPWVEGLPPPPLHRRPRTPGDAADPPPAGGRTLQGRWCWRRGGAGGAHGAGLRCAGCTEIWCSGCAETLCAGCVGLRRAGCAEIRCSSRAETQRGGCAKPCCAGCAEGRHSGFAEPGCASCTKTWCAGGAELRRAGCAELQRAGCAKPRCAGCAETWCSGCTEP